MFEHIPIQIVVDLLGQPPVFAPPSNDIFTKVSNRVGTKTKPGDLRGPAATFTIKKTTNANVVEFDLGSAEGEGGYAALIMTQ